MLACDRQTVERRETGGLVARCRVELGPNAPDKSRRAPLRGSIPVRKSRLPVCTASADPNLQPRHCYNNGPWSKTRRCRNGVLPRVMVVAEQIEPLTTTLEDATCNTF
jgi:hypothetical protein